MVSRAMLRKLMRDLLERKWSLLALAAIAAVGVGVYVSMAAVYLDLDDAKTRYYSGYHLADFSVRLKRAPEWTAASVANLPNIIRVRGRVKMEILVYPEGSYKPIQGMAISMPVTKNPAVDDILLNTGAWFSSAEAREVIADDQFASAHNLKPGDRIKMLLLDKQHDLLIVGTAMSPEFVYLIPPGGGLSPDPSRYGVFYLPREFLQKSADLEGAYNELVGMVRDKSRPSLENTLDLIQEKLDPYGVTYTTQARDQASVSVLRDELVNLKATASIFPVIFLGVAALVLNIMIGRLVAQQRVVIGTLRALGYSRRAIILHYLGYGAVAGALGGMAGVAFGIWFQGEMLDLYREFFAMPGIEPHFHPYILLSGLLISVIFGTLGTVRSARNAARLEPADAMRPPPPERGGKVVIEKMGFLWARLSFRWKMIFRSVFRNPFRSIVSLSASAVATALLVASISLNDGLNYLMNYHFDELAHQDLTLTLRDPRGTGSLGEIARLPTVSDSEPQLVVICDLENGPHKRRTPVTGLPRDIRLYTPLDAAGRPVAVPGEGLILTRKLAEILDVGEGDNLRLRPLIARREVAYAPVIRVIDSFLGLSAYCDIRYLSHLLGEDWAANSLLVSTFRGSLDRKLTKDLRARPKVIGVGQRERALKQMKATMGKFMGSFIVVMIIFAGIVAFGSIFNAALVSLSERQREVGTLRVLGYSSGQVTRIFSGESFLLNGVGIVLGLGLGIGLAHLLAEAFNTELYRLPPVIHWSRLALVAGLMTIFVVLAQWIIYLMIRSLQWLDVLTVKE